MTQQKPCNMKKWLFPLLLFLIPVIVISFFYLVYTTYRTNQFYTYVKSNQKGWSGKLHQAHVELGFVPIPDSRGLEIMPIGAPVPVRYDKNGFRVPIDVTVPTGNKHPVILTLGCSFTYGAATHAKNTFPYLVSAYTGGSTMNAGVSSYGLSQMEIIAKKLVPRFKPDYVIVQYSPWLVKRAIRPFAPSYNGKLPNPYYAEDGPVTITPPVFQSKIFELSIDSYRNSEEGVEEFLSFLWNVGFPLFFHDDFQTGKYTLAKVLRLEKRPTKNRSVVIQHAYGEIGIVAEQNGAKLIIVVLGEDSNPVPFSEKLFPKNAIVVDAHRELLNRLPIIDEENFQRQYSHWRGDPPILVDGHPNEKAHRVIAEKIKCSDNGINQLDRVI